MTSSSLDFKMMFVRHLATLVSSTRSVSRAAPGAEVPTNEKKNIKIDGCRMIMRRITQELQGRGRWIDNTSIYRAASEILKLDPEQLKFESQHILYPLS
jgi:hypothetical protein